MQVRVGQAERQERVLSALLENDPREDAPFLGRRCDDAIIHEPVLQMVADGFDLRFHGAPRFPGCVIGREALRLLGMGNIRGR